jgi:histidinol-phosphatase
MTSIGDDIAFALQMADAADAQTLDRFGALDLRVETKPDLTPVTDADRSVEELVREAIAAQRPDDVVLGEEFGGTAVFTGRQWVIDPIDGTKNFVRGVPVWATLIALMVDDEVVVGVVSAPALNRRWWAMKDGGAWTGTSLLRATAIQVSDVSRIEDASLSYASIGGWEDRDRLDDFLALSRRCWRTRAYGDFWSYMLVAEGAVDLAAEPELELYDMAALDVIVREAGGIFTSLDGEPGPNGGNALASNGKLHDQALAFLGSVDEESRHAQRGGGSVHDLAERRRQAEETSEE